MTDKPDDLLTKPFEACVVVLEDPPRCTEMILRDAAIVWVTHGDVDLGYDATKGDLVAIRVYGDVSKNPNADAMLSERRQGEQNEE